MVSNKPIGEFQADKPKKVKIIKNKYSTIQNREVIKALFIGRTLIGKYKGKTHEVLVSNEGKFIYNGKKCNAPSTVGEEITGKNCDGWEFFKVCLNPEERTEKVELPPCKILVSSK